METRKRDRQAAAHGSMDYCSGMSGLSGPSGALATTGLVDEVSEAEVVPNEPLYFSFITLVVQSTHYFFR